jgi:galactokinase
MKEIKISAPGRICLFGEHQDYLQLPVITAAIDLRVELFATPRTDKIFHIDLPDVGKTEILDFTEDKEFSYSRERDYFKSIFNVLFRKGIRWKHGWNCKVRGKIPINSGTSSSSALNNAWCRFLLEVGNDVNNEWKQPEQVGHLSYLAEVVEFFEPGGKMDQLSTAIGGVLHIDFADNDKITKLPVNLRTFVLGDSQQPKDTMKILSQSKLPAISAAQKIRDVCPEFSFSTFPAEELKYFEGKFTEQENIVMQGMIKNRDICRKAKKLMEQEDINQETFGLLLSEHHKYLRDNLNISTPKIETMLQTALDAGALGGKINGSGGGGCMFAYAPHDPQKVADAIEKVGGKTYIIIVNEGLIIK